MKRIGTALLVSVMVLLSGCSSGTPESAGSSSAAAPASSAAETAPEETPEATDAAKETPALTLDETVIYDENNIKITATGIKDDGFLGPELELLIENNGEQNITVGSDYCMINGYMMNEFLSADVAAGKKSNETLDFMNSDLKTCGIDEITDIALKLRISDSETYHILYRTEEIDLKTSLAGSYEQVYDDSGEVVYDANGIRVVARDVGEEFLGQGVEFYLENNTDQPVTVKSENVSVNGFMMTDWFYVDLAPHSHAVDTLTLLDSELKDNSIETIEEVELSLQITDSDSYAVIDSTEPITLNF